MEQLRLSISYWKNSEPRAADSWNRNGIQSLFAYIEFGEIDHETLCSIILHLLAQEKKLDDIEYAMEFLPISLLEENNHEGLCPWT